MVKETAKTITKRKTNRYTNHISALRTQAKQHIEQLSPENNNDNNL